ncbi:MAG TPA: hypothetical protein VGA22_14480 [Gemmatimonadales bacterium]
MFRRFVGLLASTLVACGQSEPSFREVIDESATTLIPKVERVVGLPFKQRPRLEVRTEAQVAQYIANRIAEDLPRERVEEVTVAYRLFGLIPDSLDVARLYEELLREQVAGYFDPDSNALFMIEGTDPTLVTFTLGHELVHALQAQYVDLRALLDPRAPNDRSTAAQAVMEGQATWAGLRLLVSDDNLAALGDFEDLVRDAIESQRAQLPVFTSAPLVIREALLFPYVGGATFMQRFAQQFPDTVPFGDRLPITTEQVLHGDRYADGDRPVELTFAADAVRFQDDLGEFETGLLLWELSGSRSVGSAGAFGWDGDRYAVLDAGPGDRALVWWSVWDGADQADRFATLIRRYWRTRPGREMRLQRAELGGQAAVGVVDGPREWNGWDRVPAVTARAP